jgi:hypothetical protein
VSLIFVLAVGMDVWLLGGEVIGIFVVLVLDTFPSICNRRLIRICGRNALGGGSRTQIEDEDEQGLRS